MNRNEPPSLLRNDAPTGNHWIKVRLEGTKSNRSAIGARVLVHYGGKVQAQTVTSQCSYISVNDPRLHFGLGSRDLRRFRNLLAQRREGNLQSSRRRISSTPFRKAKASSPAARSASDRRAPQATATPCLSQGTAEATDTEPH